MKIFDFLFGKKKPEETQREVIEKTRKEVPERTSQNKESAKPNSQIDENIRQYKENRAKLPDQDNEAYTPVQQKIHELSIEVNIALNTNNHRECLSKMVELYQTSQFVGEEILSLPVNSCQPVGFAYTTIALYFDNGDGSDDINSVAAENAFFCLAKSYMKTDNTFALPAIFTLLQKTQGLLSQKFISAAINMTEASLGMPIVMALGGNPYIDPNLQDFRDQSAGYMSHVSYYVLSKFYDIENNSFKVPEDLPLFLLSKEETSSILSSIKQEGKFSHAGYLATGKEYLDEVFYECGTTLLKF